MLNKVHNELAQIPGVKTIDYVSPDAAKDQLSTEEQKQIDVLGYNPLPPAFELKLTDPNKFEDVSAAALKVDEVRGCGNDPCVTNGADKTKRVLHWVRVIQVVLAALMLLLGHRRDRADREHDPPLDLLASARDRGDEAGRGHQLVRARAVHAGGDADRPGRLDRRRGAARAGVHRPGRGRHSTDVAHRAVSRAACGRSD